MADREYLFALEDYQRARRQAAIQELLGRITGSRQELTLLSYEEVRQRLKATEKSTQHLEEIPLDVIVGSVDRYTDFTRRFLPKKTISRSRWAKVMSLARGLSGFPPIEVYRIGEVYFVRDGNHRVSVARQLGSKTIQAYVTDVETKVPVTADLDADSLIIKAELVDFLEKTHLDQLRPGADLNATTPGAYPEILEHINVHRYFMGVNQQREIPYREAVAHWYDEVYQPVVRIIRRRGLLREFPGRTEADLYLWISRHRSALKKEVGWDISSEEAAEDLTEIHRRTPGKNLVNFIRRLLQDTLPNLLEEGPPPGTWRMRRERNITDRRLFSDILTAIDDSENAWLSLEQAARIAHLEGSDLHGLHIHARVTEQTEHEHLSLRGEFFSRCQRAGIENYDFQVVEGEVGPTLCRHARFADLVVLPLNHPPGEKPADRLESGLRALIRSCPLPILTVPGRATSLQSAVLAFDGSPKAREAMYLAAYISGQWGTELTVLTSAVGTARPQKIQREAQNYLKRYHISARYLLTGRPVPEELRDRCDQGEFDLILIGGYGTAPVLEVVLGSVVDRVLREVQLPILICR